MDTPVLLLAWRRPRALREIITAIRPVEPTRLFLACANSDPKRYGKAEMIGGSMKLIDQEIDWSCHIERSYFEINQGLRQGFIRAISWFFDHVEEGIVLDDDCIPSIDFFDYCEWALSTYRHDKSVMHINGSNFSAPSSLFSDEISFVALPHVRGWASWSDRWELLEENPFYLNRNVQPCRWTISAVAKLSVLNRLHSLEKGKSAWDCQWQITILNHHGLAICPRTNLISNVGVSLDAVLAINHNPQSLTQGGGFARPIKLQPVVNNRALTRFFEKKMGLTLSVNLFSWVCKIWLLTLRRLIKRICVKIVFGRFTPIVIASTGRAASTMMAKSIAFSLVLNRYSYLPSWMQVGLVALSKSYFDRLSDIDAFNCSPVIKTHDLYDDSLRKKFKYVFVYGDPLDSAASAMRQGVLHGSNWLSKHIFHLCGRGSADQVAQKDVLNYEAQILAWQKSPAFSIHYSEIRARNDDLSRYLGFPLKLPPRRVRAENNFPSSVHVNLELFEQLRIVEKRFNDYLRSFR